MNNIKFLLFAVFLLVLASGADALDFKSIRSGLWNDRNTWSRNGIPGPGDSAIISSGHTVTLASNQTVQSVSFVDSTAIIALAEYTLQIGGKVSGLGKFRGSSSTGTTSSLVFSGTQTGSIGTIYFDTQNNIRDLSVSLGSGSVSLGTSLVVNGIFYNLSGALDINGNVLFLNGTIFNGTGTITGSATSSLLIQGTSGGNAGTLNFTPGSQTLQNFIISRAGTGGSVSLGTNLTVINLADINNGSLLLNDKILRLQGTVSTTNGTITGSSNASLYIEGTGGNLGSVAFTPGGNSIYHLELNTNSSSYITLLTDLIVTNQLNLQAGGRIVTGANKITLGTGISNTGTYIRNGGWIDGNFERWVSNTVALYPFNTGTSFSLPVSVLFTSAPSGGRLLVSAHDTDPGMTNTNSINDNGYMIDRYSKQVWWSITTSDITGGTYTLSLTCSINLVGVSSANYTQLRVLKRPDSSSPWGVEGVHGNATANPNYYNPIVYRSGLTTFSEFGIGGYSTDGNTLGDDPLPVTLKSFTSSVNGRNVKLNWVTEKEINNQGFDIERIENGKQNSGKYEKIGFVESKGGNNAPVSYSFEDKNLNSGKYNYRLKQIDYNGNFEYFELTGGVTIGVPSKFDLSQNYPNPFNPVTKINFDLPEDGKLQIKVYDISGREVATVLNEFRTAGFHTLIFDASKLPSGVYFYRMNAENFSATKKMVLVK